MNITSKPKKEIIIREKGERLKHLQKLKSALVLELDFQSDLAQVAFNELENAIEESDELKIWYSVQMFLFTSERISDLLEEIKVLVEKDHDDIKTEDLRPLSEMASDLMIKQDELSKNFGEKLEKWILEPGNNHIIENHIFQKRSVPNLSVEHVLRHFDPETYEMTFRNRTYDLKNDHGTIQEIKQNLEEVYEHNLWNI